MVFILTASSGVNERKRSGSVLISPISTTCPDAAGCRDRDIVNRPTDRSAGRDRRAPAAGAAVDTPAAADPESSLRSGRSDGMSSDSGVAPAPIAALLFRSSTESLFPSQCSHSPLPHPLVPQRRQVGGADRVVGVHIEAEQPLVRVERVDAAGALRRPLVEPGVLRGQPPDALPGGWNHEQAVGQPVPPREGRIRLSEWRRSGCRC